MEINEKRATNKGKLLLICLMLSLATVVYFFFAPATPKAQAIQKNHALTTTSDWLILDAGLVYGPLAKEFNIATFVQEQNGFLNQHSEYVEGFQLTGAQIVQLIAERFSVNPKLLLAFVEYRSGWVTKNQASLHPLGDNTIPIGLYWQLYNVANQLNRGFYSRANRQMEMVRLRDGTLIHLDSTLNDGTVGVMHALTYKSNGTASDWYTDIGRDGLMATYRAMFGDPFNEYADLYPYNVTQPPLELPWAQGQTWYLTGGPHGAWGNGSAWASIDFAPPGNSYGCYVSQYFVTAAAAGTISRSFLGAVTIDLDDDGYSGTGWAIHYMHLAYEDRVPLGTYVEVGDPIGRPACVGGYSTGTHVHLSRSYNGRWVSAVTDLPFVIGGWTVHTEGTEYSGYMSKNGYDILSLQGRGINGITR